MQNNLSSLQYRCDDSLGLGGQRANGGMGVLGVGLGQPPNEARKQRPGLVLKLTFAAVRHSDGPEELRQQRHHLVQPNRVECEEDGRARDGRVHNGAERR